MENHTVFRRTSTKTVSQNSEKTTKIGNLEGLWEHFDEEGNLTKSETWKNEKKYKELNKEGKLEKKEL